MRRKERRMALLNKQTVLEHLYKRLIETANNNVGFECDASIVFEGIATDRIKTWLDEVQTVDAEPVRHGKWHPCDKKGYILTETALRDGRRWYGYKCSECNDIYHGNALKKCKYCLYP